MILAHLSHSLTNYLRIKHSGAVIAHLSVGASQHYCKHGIGVDDDDETFSYRERKLNEQTGNHNIQSIPSLQSPKKFLLDIKYILTRKRGCSALNAPTSPMSTLMIIAIQGRQLHH